MLFARQLFLYSLVVCLLLTRTLFYDLLQKRGAQADDTTTTTPPNIDTISLPLHKTSTPQQSSDLTVDGSACEGAVGVTQRRSKSNTDDTHSAQSHSYTDLGSRSLDRNNVTQSHTYSIIGSRSDICTERHDMSSVATPVGSSLAAPDASARDAADTSYKYVKSSEQLLDQGLPTLSKPSL